MFKRLLLFLILIFVSLWSPLFASAQELPEKDGIYNVPGNSKLKLRVFGHNKGRPTPDPVVGVCSADNDSLSVVGGTGWHLPFNWSYRLNEASVPSTVGAASLATISAQAFNSWGSATNNAVNFSYVGTTSAARASFDGQNIIAWGRTSGSALGVTYTWYDPASGLVVETDTIMNKKFSWSLNMCSTSSYDAQNILTHEIGHWVGMDDEYTSEFVDNTMYGYGSKAENKKNTLTSGDMTGAYLIYH